MEIEKRVLEERDLDLLSYAQSLLERATEPRELVEVSKIAATITGHARSVRAGLKAQNEAAEVHLRAQRKLGEMLMRTPLSKGGRPSSATSPASPESGN